MVAIKNRLLYVSILKLLIMLKLQDEVRLCVAFLRVFCASYLFCLLHLDYVFNFLSSIGINYSYNDCYESMINDRYQQTDN